MNIPFPPEEMRRLVGPVAESDYDNPGGEPILRDLPPEAWDHVVDFGCGCGRIARKLIQQIPRPRRYLGLDLHPGMIRWCRSHLQSLAPGFEFVHQDVRNIGLNPGGTLEQEGFPVADGSASLLLAWSVFTHLLQPQAEFYLGEVARTLRPDGIAVLTFFLFEKRDFPMMQSFQNALFINPEDPTNAVIFDREWLLSRFRAHGLKVVAAERPGVRGFQWLLRIAPETSPLPAVALPADDADFGSVPAPLLPYDAARIGLDD